MGEGSGTGCGPATCCAYVGFTSAIQTAAAQPTAKKRWNKTRRARSVLYRQYWVHHMNYVRPFTMKRKHYIPMRQWRREESQVLLPGALHPVRENHPLGVARPRCQNSIR